MATDDQGVEAVDFSRRLVELSMRETSAPSVAIVGLLEALAFLVVLLSEQRGSKLAEARARVLHQLGTAIDMIARKP